MNLIHHLLKDPSSGLQYVAEVDEELVGFATLYFTFSTLSIKKQGIMNDMYVASHAKGQKIGEKLFEKCLDYIREKHFSSMTWETAQDNIVKMVSL